MKTILVRNVKDLGKAGDVVNVADGYARNYLIPRKLAIEATDGSLRHLDRQHTMESKRDEKLLTDAQELASRIAELSVIIVGKVGQGTRLYGSITSQDIADALKAQHKIEIDKRKIDVLEPIKTLGSFSIPIRVLRTVTGNLQVEVLAPGQPAPVKPAPVVEAVVEPVAAPVAEVAAEPVAVPVVEPVAEEKVEETPEATDQPQE